MISKMKAGVLHAIGDINCEEVDIPEISENEVLIAVKYAGICGTDFERVLKTGTWRFPTVLGHEFGGKVTKVGNNVKNLNIGDKVVVNPMIPCGECKYCKTGNYNMCVDYDYLGSRSNGGFAEFAKAKWTNVMRVPSEMTYEAMASIDPIAVALHGVIKGEVKLGDSVAVFGAGPIGHYIIQWAKIMGASKVIAIDIVDEKLEIAKKLGADYCINAKKEKNVVNSIISLTDEEGVNVAIESAGSPITVLQCVKIAKKFGTVVYLGTPHSDVSFEDKIFESILRKEINIVGSWCYHFAPPIHEWEMSIEKVSKGEIDYNSVISHKFELAEIKEAFEMIKNRKEFFNKVIIKVNEEE
jgi:L-iditol 2-dehydrogenase